MKKFFFLILLCLIISFGGLTSCKLQTSMLSSSGSSSQNSSEQNNSETLFYSDYLKQRLCNGYQFSNFVLDGLRNTNISLDEVVTWDTDKINDTFGITGSPSGEPDTSYEIYDDYTEEQKNTLLNRNINKDKATELTKLNYSYEQMESLSDEEYSIIFEGEKLTENLKNIGFTYYRINEELAVDTTQKAYDEYPNYRTVILKAINQPSYEEFVIQASEKEISDWEIEALLERGFIYNDILTMTEQRRTEVLTPGVFVKGYSPIIDTTPEAYVFPDTYLFPQTYTEPDVSYSEYHYYSLAPSNIYVMNQEQFSQEELSSLSKQKSIESKMIVILQNLGYSKDEILNLDQKEINFIFPISNLRTKLKQCGFTDEVITLSEQWLKYLIRNSIEFLEVNTH